MLWSRDLHAFTFYRPQLWSYFVYTLISDSDVRHYYGISAGLSYAGIV